MGVPNGLQRQFKKGSTSGEVLLEGLSNAAVEGYRALALCQVLFFLSGLGDEDAFGCFPCVGVDTMGEEDAVQVP